jgi:hypothetical protein
MVRRVTHISQANLADQPQQQPVTVPVYTAPAQPAQPVASVPSPIADLRTKFARLKAINAKLGYSDPVFREKDALLEELLPYFVSITPTDIIIHREITIGNERHTITPLFIDPETQQLRAKVFKSKMVETFTIW